MGDQGARSRIEILEALRGIAALSVAWFHFTNGGSLVVLEPLKSTGTYGWLGVQVFFVISGFIIPYSLYRGGYTFPRNMGQFVMKRLLRLEPPYIAAIALTLGLLYLSAAHPDFRGPRPEISTSNLLLHLGYLNAFFGYPWLNPVFWTLAIEFQFYLLAAVAYPLLVHESRYVRLLVLTGMCAASYLFTNAALVFHFGGLFALGLLAFYKYVGFINTRLFLLLSVVFSALLTIPLGIAVTLAGLSTALIIGFVRVRRYTPLVFLGSISYSLYLLHAPIGGRVVNLGSRFADSLFTQTVVLVLALAASLVAASLMYRLVERPAQKWSSAVSYATKKT